MGSLSSGAQGLDHSATTCSRLPVTPGTEKRSVKSLVSGTHALANALTGGTILPASCTLGSALLGSTQLAAQNNASASDQKPISSAQRFCSGGRGREGGAARRGGMILLQRSH